MLVNFSEIYILAFRLLHCLHVCHVTLCPVNYNVSISVMLYYIIILSNLPFILYCIIILSNLPFMLHCVYPCQDTL